MTFKRLSASFSAAAQLFEPDLASAAEAGFRMIIDNRPDGEDAGQLGAAAMEALANIYGLAFAHIPVVSGAKSEADIARMRGALRSCRVPFWDTADPERARR